jgi:hypothetical protein
MGLGKIKNLVKEFLIEIKRWDFVQLN